MARQRGMSFDKFRQRFQTNESCREYLYQLRWPRGFVCPRCGAAGGYPIKGRSEYSCKHCHKQTSVTAGTVMHRTHLPLTVWFWAMYLVARDKRGISATQLSRELEIAYSSAWYLLQRLRSAMGKRDQKYILSGTIELDDAYFGTPSVGGPARSPAGRPKRPASGTAAPGKEAVRRPGQSPARSGYSRWRLLARRAAAPLPPTAWRIWQTAEPQSPSAAFAGQPRQP